MKPRVTVSSPLVSTATTFEIPEMAPRNQATGYQAVGTCFTRVHPSETGKNPKLIPGTSCTTVRTVVYVSGSYTAQQADTINIYK